MAELIKFRPEEGGDARDGRGETGATGEARSVEILHVWCVIQKQVLQNVVSTGLHNSVPLIHMISRVSFHMIYQEFHHRQTSCLSGGSKAI